MFLNGYPYSDFHELNLDWIISHFKEFVDAIASLDQWRSEHELEYEELKSFMDSLNDGIVPPEMFNTIKTWLQNNIYDIVGETIRFITVSLNDAGYIVFTFPALWNDIIFNTTGLDINTPLQPEYGHLTISY